MARSRIGGSSGLLSGKVADIIYSVTRDSNGKYRQIVSASPTDPYNPNTDEQARARLTMATIERAMFTYRDMMGTGFEGVDRGTNSVSKFSEVNYNYFKDYIKFAWENNLDDYVRLSLPHKGQTVPQDGEFIISQGSLRPFVNFTGTMTAGRRMILRYKMVSLQNYSTLKEALWETRINIGDQVAGFFYAKGVSPSYSTIIWFTIFTDPQLSQKTVITPQNFRNIIQLKSNVDCSLIYDDTEKAIFVITDDLAWMNINAWGSRGWRRRHVVNGKVCYSTQQMKNPYPNPWSQQSWQQMSQVKDSWLNI